MTEETAVLGGGCFWCIEAVLRRVEGVLAVTNGYAGGHVPDPTYEEVCRGTTGHAEVVQVTFDPDVLPYRDLLAVFFSVHDPTTRNRQGHDVGTQYRSLILAATPAQRKTAEAVIADLEGEGIWKGIVTQVEDLGAFYPAEAYHQRYYEDHPEAGYCQVVIAPKLGKLRKRWSGRLRDVPL